MMKLKKPVDQVSVVFRACISRVRDASLRQRLNAASSIVQAESANFERAVETYALHGLVPAVSVGSVSTKEMISLYDGRMVKEPGRQYYDKLKAASPHGICPRCGQRDVSTLDHHAAKTRFPALVVTPTNLVPCCAECNFGKLAKHPAKAEEQVLHPYFHDLGNERWLVAEVQRPLALWFSIGAVAGWPPELGEIAKNHFRTFKLSNLYATHSARLLVGIRAQLLGIHANGGRAAVSSHLSSSASSWLQVNPNAWQTAAYEALAADEWFCSGGFNDIEIPSR